MQKPTIFVFVKNLYKNKLEEKLQFMIIILNIDRKFFIYKLIKLLKL